MDKTKKIALIEGLLFINGDAGVDINELCVLCELGEDEIRTLLQELKAKYENDDRSGLDIQLFAQTHYRMTTKKDDAVYYKKLATIKTEAKLSTAALETLSIIAYKGPITRMEIEEIRGVNCENVIYKLKLRNFIAESAEKSEKPGRGYHYVVTTDFLKYFNLNSLDELPQLEASDENEKAMFN